jgi:uncharacterized protein YkvS
MIRCARNVARVVEKVNALSVLKERHHFEDLGVDEGTILKWTLKIQNGFIGLRID